MILSFDFLVGMLLYIGTRNSVEMFTHDAFD